MSALIALAAGAAAFSLARAAAMAPAVSLAAAAGLILFSSIPAVLLFAAWQRQHRREAESIRELTATVARHRAELEHHRQAIEHVVDSLREGLLAVNAQGRVVFANQRLSELFGVAGALQGLSVLEVVRKSLVADAIDRALRGEASAEQLTLSSGGEERQVEMRAVAVPGPGEIAAVALFIDISDLVRLQRIRRDFLEDFSHEVRTPLAGVRSAAETLDEGRLSPEHEHELRQVMLRQLGRIERLVQDLAELNRIESGELELDRHPVELASFLRDLCAEFQGRLDLSWTVSGGPVLALADPMRLQQVFSNLLDNASKHGGGEVALDVGREESEAVVRVSDRGEGIAPGEAERIFHRFYRVDRSRSQETPGVGLGLAIAKHLVLIQGGAIRAYNRPERGATFEVRLPLHEDS